MSYDLIIFTVRRHDVDRRVFQFLPGLDDHLVDITGLFVRFDAEGLAFNDVFVLDSSGDFGEDHGVERIPVS